MQYAEIAVNVPVGVNDTFTYSVPSHFLVTIGQLVSVPLKNNLVEGIVFSVYKSKIRNDIKPINNVIYSKSLVSYKNLILARSISQYYMKPLFSITVSFFPPGFRNGIQKFLLLNKNHILSFSRGKELIKLGRVEGRNLLEIEEKKFLHFIKTNYDRQEIKSFLQNEKIKKIYRLSPPLIKKSYICFINLSSIQSRNVLEKLKKSASKQWELIQYLNLKGRKSSSNVRRIFGAGPINGCFEKGFIYFEWDSSNNKVEYSEQYKSLVDLKSASLKLRNIFSLGVTAKPILLHCSSVCKKIEAYSFLIREMLLKGKQVLIVCPEFHSAKQVYDEISNAFDYQIGFFVSEGRYSKRLNTWQAIKTGKIEIIIGTKVALFCSFKNLGLVIVDDEECYSDYALDFNIRFEFDVRVLAIQLAKQNNALSILTSLSPSISSYFKAKKKQYSFVFYDSNPLSPANTNSHIIDMTQEVKNGNYSIISQYLLDQINKVKSEKGKTLLFFNRRGEAIFIRCNSCFESIKCKDCLISFRYHSDPARLICHSCGKEKHLPLFCEMCSSQDFQKVGYGIQRIEKELNTLLPYHKITRWDSDILPSKLSKSFWEKFPNDFDILIGTIGVIRYLEFLDINFIGIISVEQALQVNDFRSVEKQYQIFSKLIKFIESRSVENKQIALQSFQPEWNVLRFLVNGDYIKFYNEEINKRQKRALPPFLRLTRLFYADLNREKAKIAVYKFAKILRSQIATSRNKDIVIGPFPCYPELVDNKYHWEIFLKGKDPSMHIRRMKIPRGWHIQVDA